MNIWLIIYLIGAVIYAGFVVGVHKAAYGKLKPNLGEAAATLLWPLTLLIILGSSIGTLVWQKLKELKGKNK